MAYSSGSGGDKRRRAKTSRTNKRRPGGAEDDRMPLEMRMPNRSDRAKARRARNKPLEDTRDAIRRAEVAGRSKNPRKLSRKANETPGKSKDERRAARAKDQRGGRAAINNSRPAPNRKKTGDSMRAKKRKK